MKILVIDDNADHRRAATEALIGHDVICVGTYDDAQKALTPQLDYDAHEHRTEELTTEAGFPGTHKNYLKDEVGEEKWAAYWKVRYEAGQRAREELTVHPDFDVVLTDLMMPPSKQALAPQAYKHLTQEMPLGTFLLLLAMRAGVKKVGLVTDTNHHHHPASAAIDVFHVRQGPFIVGDTAVLCWNYGKNWAKVLGLLNGEKLE